MRPSRSTIKRMLAGLAASAVLLILAAPFLIQPLINSRPVKLRLIQDIKTHTGMDIHPETVEFFLAPVPGIRFLDTDIQFNDQFHLFIESSEISVDLSQAVQGKLAISRIKIQGPRLGYTPSKRQPSKAAATDVPPFHFRLPVEVIDELFSLFPDTRKDLEIVVDQAQTDYFSSMDARFTVFQDRRSMDFKARIGGIDLNHGQIPELDASTGHLIKFLKVKELIIKVSLNKANTLEGRINLIQPEAGLFDIPDSPLQSPGLDLVFSVSDKSAYATLAPADLIYPEGRVGIDFRHHSGEKRTMLAFTGSNVDIGKAREVCLPLLGQEEVVATLFDILRAGKTKDIKVEFAAPTLGDLFDGRHLHLAGTAASATVKIPEVPLTVRDVSGSATMENGILHIEAQKGVVRSTAIKGGVLDIDLVNDVAFKGRFNLSADLSSLPGTLQDLLPGTALAQALNEVKKISGKADAVLELGMAPDEQDLDVRVHATGIQASADYGLIPLPLSVSAGEFFYETGLIRLKGLAGTIGKSPLRLEMATIRLKETPDIRIENQSGTLFLAELMPWLTATPKIMDMISPARRLNGRLDISNLDIKGPVFFPGQWTFTAQGKASQLDIGFDDDTSAGISNLSCEFTADQNRLDITGLAAQVRDISWLSGAVDPAYLSSIRMPLGLADVSIKERQGKDLFHGRITTPGGPEIGVDLKGETISDLVPTLIMIKDATITDALIIPNPGPDKPILSFDGRLNTLTVEKLLVRGSALHNKLIALTSGEPISCFTDSASRIRIDARRINLDTLLSGPLVSEPSKPGTPKKNGRPLLAQKTLILRTDQLIYQEREFQDVRARVFFDPEQTQVKISNAILCDLSALGDLTIPHDSRNMTTHFTISSVQDRDISTSLGCLLGTESLIKGGYVFKADLKGNGLPDHIAARQNGIFSFDAERGRIYKATLLSRVLSVLNILGDTDLRQQGFGYKTITIQGDVKDSVIHLNKAYIDADDMAIIASGWIAPFTDRLDVTFLVAPLKTIDTIIQHIPVVNTILSGRLVSLPAKASGKLSDPTVIPLHPSAVGKGLITLFGDLLKAPVRLIQGDSNNNE